MDVRIPDKPAKSKPELSDQYAIWEGSPETGVQKYATHQGMLNFLKDHFYTEQEIDDDYNITTAARDRSFDDYDDGFTYQGGTTYYVDYGGYIYQFIHGTNTTGEDPDESPEKWDQVSVGEFAHLQNTDQYLDQGGANEISAATIESFISSAGDALGPILSNASNKIPSSYLPDISVIDYLGSVANEAAMLALVGEKGDWCIREDDAKVYIITGDDPSQASDWTALSYPTGLTGVGQANRVTYWDGLDSLTFSAVTSTELGYLTGATSNIQNQLDGKANLSGATFTGTVSVPVLQIDGTTVITAAAEVQNVTGQISLWSNDVGYLTSVDSTLQDITDNGNSTTNAVYINNNLDADSYSIDATVIVTNGRVLQNVSGNISMFTNDAGYVSGLTFGSQYEIPYVNATTDAWDHYSGFRFNGSALIIDVSSETNTSPFIIMHDSTGQQWNMRVLYTTNQFIIRDATGGQDRLLIDTDNTSGHLLYDSDDLLSIVAGAGNNPGIEFDTISQNWRIYAQSSNGNFYIRDDTASRNRLQINDGTGTIYLYSISTTTDFNMYMASGGSDMYINVRHSTQADAGDWRLVENAGYGQILRWDTSASRFVVYPTLRVSNAYNLPTSDGSSNQVLTTNGSGVVSWTTVSGSGVGDLQTVTNSGNTTSNSVKFGQNSGSPTYTVSAYGSIGIESGSGGSLYLNDSNIWGLNKATFHLGYEIYEAANNNIVFNAATSDCYINIYGNGVNNGYIYGGGSDVIGILDSGSEYIAQFNRSSSSNSNIKLYADSGLIMGYLYGSSGGYFGTLDSDGNWAYQHLTDTHHKWFINNSEKLRLESSGDLDVLGHIQSANGYFTYGSIGTNGSDYMRITGNDIRFVVNGSEVFRMESDADFHADGDVIAYSTTISDPRAKSFHGRIDQVHERIARMSGYSFTWTHGRHKGRRDYGFNAHEVQQALPDAIRIKKDKIDRFGFGDFMTFNSVSILALHNEGLKDHERRIKELENEVRHLKAQLNR